jgi:hypothetical protein
MVDQRDVGQESTLVVKMAEVVDRETCTKLVVEVKWEGAVGHKVLFVKGTWNPTTFSLALSDGLQAWIFEGMYLCYVCMFLKQFFDGGKHLGVYVCFSTILMIENILGMFVSLNNLDDVKHLGMFVSQQF